MRDINVLEQRLCLHIPRVVLGGVIQGKAETKTVVPSPRLPVSPVFCSEAAQKLLSPRTPNAACTLLGLPPYPPTLPTGGTYGAGPGPGMPIGYVKSEILQNRNVTEMI